jgi:hypothetical protein
MWGTTDEIKFINGLGNHRSPRAVVPYEEKLEYLMRYLEGNALRVRWGPIDSATVRMYAESRVEYYESLIQKKHPPIPD